MTQYRPTEHDPILRELLQLQLSDTEIGLRLGGIGWQTIRRRRQFLGLGPPPKKVNTRPKREPEPLEPVSTDNFVTHAAISLGAEERPGKGYFLNGRPISAKEMMQRVNARRKAKGMPQIGPECWWV